jgi:hypothetical protein
VGRTAVINIAIYLLLLSIYKLEVQYRSLYKVAIHAECIGFGTYALRDIDMKLLVKTRCKKKAHITARTKDDFLIWLKKTRIAEEDIYAKALSTWADDGGQSIRRYSHLGSTE